MDIEKEAVTKEQALEAVQCLAEDFALLASGDWAQDDASCEASLKMVERLRRFVEAAK